MSSVKDVSRQLYTNTITAVYPYNTPEKSSVLFVNRIWEIILIVENRVSAADNITFTPVDLSNKLTTYKENFKTIFYNYIFSTINYIPTAPPLIANNNQNKSLFESFYFGILNTLFAYIETDEEFFLTTSKESLESLFSLLIIGLNDYRKYFTVTPQSSYANFLQVNNVLNETPEQKNLFFNDSALNTSTLDKSVALNNVDINNPIPFVENGKTYNWKELFTKLKDTTYTAISSNMQIFHVKNSMSNSLEFILRDEIGKFDSASNYVSNYSFEGSHVDNNTKIKVTSLITDDTFNSLSNHSVIYYNSKNARTRSKISSIDLTNKKLTLNPYNGLSNDVKTFDLLTIKEGINIEKTFESTTISSTNSRLCSIFIVSGTTTLKNIDLKIEPRAFQTNYIGFPIATANPISNGWVLNTVNPTNNSNLSVSFYRDTTNNNFIINKNDYFCNGTIFYTSFYINDINEQLNVNFKYTILNRTFASNNLTVQIVYFNNGVETVLKTLNPLNNTYNTSLDYSDTFTPTRQSVYRLKFTFNSFINPLKISFSNFYVGKNNFNQNSITYSNPKKLISDLYLNDDFKNNFYFSISYSQITNIDANGNSTISYKMKLTSEPTLLGSNITFTFSNINTNFNWFVNSPDNVFTGVDPIKILDTGYEKKYYELFISLNKRIFAVLNAYALARLIVPEIFNEEEEEFNTGSKINFNIKRYINDLVQDIKDDYDFQDDLIKDPRSNFLQKAPKDTLGRSTEWKSGGFKDVLGLKKFNKMKSELQKIKKALKKVKSVLDAIKAFLDILDQLIELGEDILGALLDQVISQVQGVVDNIASTGVYWLPVIEYYATDNKDHWFVKAVTNDLNVIVNPYGNSETDEPNITLSNGFLKELAELQGANASMMADSLNSDAAKVRGGDRAERWKSGIPGLPFRSTTYDEFINVIISQLLDEGDLPELGLKEGATKGTTIKDPKSGVYWGKKDPNQTLPFSFSPSVIRPGAPKWTKGSQSMVVIVAVCLPAPEDLFAGLDGLMKSWKFFLKSILLILKPINTLINTVFTGITNSPPVNSGEKRKDQKLKNLRNKKKEKDLEIQNINTQLDNIDRSVNPTKYNELNDKWKKKVEELEEIEKEIQETVDDQDFSDDPIILKLNDLIAWIESKLELEESEKESSKPSPKSSDEATDAATDAATSGVKRVEKEISDWWNETSMLDEALDARGGRFTGSRGTYPDFYGFTLGSLMPSLFSVIKGFLRKLKKLNEKESTFSLSEKFQELVEPIEDFISEVEDVIQSIDDIINALDAILNCNISYLVIKSEGGVNDIINQLENATSFPNEDKRQIILGGLLGAGMINPNGNEFNFSQYFNDAAQEFKEDKADLFNDLKLSNEEKGIDFLNKFFK
jgi:hypothetical protein